MQTWSAHSQAIAAELKLGQDRDEGVVVVERVEGEALSKPLFEDLEHNQGDADLSSGVCQRRAGRRRSRWPD